tara:strand:+ start:167 stop:397 length:231 start_codon:yes stop_codon:yes gene_type:complete
MENKVNDNAIKAEEPNVININGTDYKENDLSEQQHYFINQIKDLQLKANNLKFQLDQVQVALDTFTNELLKSLEGK